MAKITFQIGNETLTAHLGTDGVWECPLWPTLALVMTNSYGIYRETFGAAHETPGLHTTMEWAEILDGKAEFPDYPVIPGAIY